MAAADRFSGLPDGLLVHVISFLPAREAARAAVLSRRWRPLWLRTAAVNLDSRPYGRRSSQVKERLFRDAGAALRAPGRCPVRRLSLFVKGSEDRDCQNMLGKNRVDALLADPALRRMEELRVGFEFRKGNSGLRYIYELRRGALPGHTLRVLDLACCRLELPPHGVAFPRLAELRLDRCSSPMHHLQALIRAAPNLSSLCIRRQDFFCYPRPAGSDRFALHCPSLTALTLDWASIAIDLYAPCLRTFSYTGHYTEFSMESDATSLARVNLDLRSYGERDGKQCAALVWRFLRSLRHAKVLKLHVLCIQDIAVDKDLQDEHLATLLSLERLEIEGAYDPGRRKGATAAIASLLHCCPVMRDLQLRLRTNSWDLGSRRGSRSTEELAFDVSMDLFNRRGSKEIALMLDDNDDDSSGVAELHGLSDCWFNCLHNHLRNVKLQFELKGPNSFEVCLAKFFAENCRVLEVLQIDDGNQSFLSHVNRMVERWRVKASKRRNGSWQSRIVWSWPRSSCFVDRFSVHRPYRFLPFMLCLSFVCLLSFLLLFGCRVGFLAEASLD